jgi:hypothetical protein
VIAINEHFATQACAVRDASSSSGAHDDVKQTQGASL